MTFYGNPNVTITAIDTSGGIVCWRTSGQTPCFIHASSKAITATGTSKPYRDLECSWNFGDPASTEIFDDPYTRSTANTNSDQIRPSAVHCYRSAGTYTITLTIRGKNGSGFTTATVTQQITVTTYNASGGDWYFDFNAAVDGTGSIGSPFNTVAHFNTKAAIANAALHVSRGNNKTATTGLVVDNGPLRIDAYGVGDDPIFDITSGSANAMRFAIGSAFDHSDIVISGLKLRRSGSASGEIFAGVLNNVGAVALNFYLDNCTFSSALSSGVGAPWVSYQTSNKTEPAKFSGFGMWGCSLISEAGDTARDLGFFGGAIAWSFFYGDYIEGTGGNALLDHHMYPVVKTNSDYGYNQFGPGSGRNYCMNTDWEKYSGSFETAEYHCVSNCEFFGVLRAFDASNGGIDPDLGNDPTDIVFDNFVVQRCSFHGLTGDGVIAFYCGAGITLRDYDVWDCEGGRFWVPGGPSTAVYDVYNGRLYHTGAVFLGGTIFDFATIGALSNAQTFTNNVVYDTRTTGKLISLDSFAGYVSNGSLIQGNQYYIPNDTDSKSWYDGTTARAFAAEWQGSGFDVNGSVADPKWNNPAIGDFSVYVGFSSGLAAPGTPNTQCQFGLRHVGYLSSGSPDYQLSVRSIQSSYATAIYYGDPIIKLASTQYIAPALGNQTTVIGVFQGCMYWPKVGNMPVWSRFWPGGPQRTDATAYIVDAPTALFLSAALLTAVPSSAIGQNIGFALGATPSTAGLGCSSYVVDQSTMTTSSAEPFQVYALYQGVGNGSDQASNYNWVVVCFNNERFKTQTGNA